MEVKTEDIGKRIDKYLTEQLDYSRTIIQKMLEEEKITVNNTKVKPSYKLEENDTIKILEEYKEENTLTGENIPLDIVYEDNDLLIINKQSGMVVHPGNGNKEHTLVNALIGYTNNLSTTNDEIRPGIVHRIDKDTSGLIVVAKNNKTHELLAEMFKNKTINRYYIALVQGQISVNEGIIDAPIGRDPNMRKRYTVTQTNSKTAITHFKVLKRYKGYTLIKLKLDTGRTHQIRVHMKYIGHPVYNDPVYTNPKSTPFGQFLHSSQIDFIHPITKKQITLETPLPKEFQDFIDTLTTID